MKWIEFENMFPIFAGLCKVTLIDLAEGVDGGIEMMEPEVLYFHCKDERYMVSPTETVHVSSLKEIHIYHPQINFETVFAIYMYSHSFHILFYKLYSGLALTVFLKTFYSSFQKPY